MQTTPTTGKHIAARHGMPHSPTNLDARLRLALFNYAFDRLPRLEGLSTVFYHYRNDLS